jgi:hypothetical protein
MQVSRKVTEHSSECLTFLVNHWRAVCWLSVHRLVIHAEFSDSLPHSLEGDAGIPVSDGGRQMY